MSILMRQPQTRGVALKEFAAEESVQVYQFPFTSNRESSKVLEMADRIIQILKYPVVEGVKKESILSVFSQADGCLRYVSRTLVYP